MFVGHIGVALALTRADPRVNSGVLVTAALLLDIVLWAFVLIGWESVSIPADFAASHQPEFVFPYSHGLAATVFWSALAGAAGSRIYHASGNGWRAAVVISAAVFSHWLLDAIVHRPELPLGGVASPKVGLGLWNWMPAALVAEAALLFVGVYLAVRGSNLSRVRAIAVVTLGLMLLAFTILGMTIAPAPPSAQAMAGSSLATIVVICGLASWIGRVEQV